MIKTIAFDAVVIGAGAAGMAAAYRLAEDGHSVAIVEREEYLGGILNQCIHNGFGLHEFKEELTGPEYAERYCTLISKSNIKVFNMTTVVDIENSSNRKTITAYSSLHGALRIETKAIVLAMGCRERNRGNIGIPGTRPSGVFTAGLAQRLINIDGFVPGHRAVIIGSGDIGLIMARRLTWIGSKVPAVIEILPYPSGLTRNISQCLNDFEIPLYLSHIVSSIHGKERVTGVDVTPVSGGKPEESKSFYIPCDTVLLSVGLIPENELSKKAGVEINHDTGGPYVDSHFMTSVPGIFASGNVLHVHDLVDFVTEESKRCASFVSQYLSGKEEPCKQFKVRPGANTVYIVPNQYVRERENRFYLRSFIIKNDAVLFVKSGTRIIKEKKLLHVQPSEMVSFTLPPRDMESIKDNESELEISIQ